ADDNARDPEGARDAARMATAYRALATLLDPATFPSPVRAPRIPEGALSLITPEGVPIERMEHG
ncbi:MAG: hypothetical protein H7Y15_14885, partial [Pseudonocardia sp.]|nr:hypothetical protein [Pseudonocardia sp.]